MANKYAQLKEEQDLFSDQETSIPIPTMAPTQTQASSSDQGLGIIGGAIRDSGNSNQSQSAANNIPSNTLDEPIQETIMRDLRNIGNKIQQVLDPRPNNKENILRDWDWWGPLLLCLTLSVRLSLSTVDSDKGAAVFAATFVIIWFGSAIVTVNSQLLGGNISLYQSVCVLGYCVFPLVASSFITWILPFFLKLIVVCVAYMWSTYASINFLTDIKLENRRLLAVYPIFLFYVMIGWLILIAE